VRQGALSPFVGFPESTSANGHGGSRPAVAPLEWEALNAITSQHLYRIGTVRKEVDATLGPQSGALGAVVSSHFRGVIKRAEHDASFFRQAWKVVDDNGAEPKWVDQGKADLGKDGNRYARLVCEREMHSPVALGTESGSVNRVRVIVVMPKGAGLRHVSGQDVNAWVLGTVPDWTTTEGTLEVIVKPMAVLKDLKIREGRRADDVVED
jgi:hypothetical protein